MGLSGLLAPLLSPRDSLDQPVGVADSQMSDQYRGTLGSIFELTRHQFRLAGFWTSRNPRISVKLRAPLALRPPSLHGPNDGQSVGNSMNVAGQALASGMKGCPPRFLQMPYSCAHYVRSNDKILRPLRIAASGYSTRYIPKDLCSAAVQLMEESHRIGHVVDRGGNRGRISTNPDHPGLRRLSNSRNLMVALHRSASSRPDRESTQREDQLDGHRCLISADDFPGRNSHNAALAAAAPFPVRVLG